MKFRFCDCQRFVKVLSFRGCNLVNEIEAVRHILPGHNRPQASTCPPMIQPAEEAANNSKSNHSLNPPKSGGPWQATCIIEDILSNPRS